MNNQNLIRGLFLMAIALAFGLGALRYPLGELSRAGPGLFPFMIAAMLAVVALSMIIRSAFVPRAPMDFRVRNIALILGSLCAFALTSHFVNMILGIAVMVFIASLAGEDYSVKRCLKIIAVLVGIALAFQHGLGLQLPLY